MLELILKTLENVPKDVPKESMALILEKMKQEGKVKRIGSARKGSGKVAP